MDRSATSSLAIAETLHALGALVGRQVALQLHAGSGRGLVASVHGELRDTFSAFESAEDLDTALIVQVGEMSTALWANGIGRVARYRRPPPVPGQWLMRVAIELRDGTTLGLRELGE